MKNINKALVLLSFIALCGMSALVFPDEVKAGFGVTPPYVENSELTRNSIYEQRIMLVRGSPDFDMNAEISVDVPGAEDWITVEPGREVLLPEGEQRVPITVRLEIPDNAEFGNYSGRIRVRTRAADDGDRGQGAVSIALGAQINVDVDIIDRVIREFDIRQVKISDFNEGRTQWWLEYPGKMLLEMTLRNTGNVPVAPDRVTVDIYDSSGNELLEQTEHTNKIEEVNPFNTGVVTAELPSHLPPGSYRGRFAIYNGDEVVRSGELSFGIRTAGTIEGDDGYGFMGLSLWHQFTIVGPIVLLILLIVIPVFTFSRRARRMVKASVFKCVKVIRSFIYKIKRIATSLGGFITRRRAGVRRR